MKNFWKIATKIQLNFFDRIVTANETSIYHYDPLSQQEAKTWKKPSEKTPTQPPVTRSADKIIINIFWHCQGVLLVNFLPHSTTINSSYYASLLHRLRSCIQKKLRRGVLLPHDKAPVHKSNITQAVIQCRGITELNHFVYSPDLAVSDYHLFSNLKNFLRDRNFESDNGHERLFGEC